MKILYAIMVAINAAGAVLFMYGATVDHSPIAAVGVILCTFFGCVWGYLLGVDP